MLIEEIEKDLECYDQVFLIDDGKLAEQFCRSEAFAAIEKDIKIYLPDGIDIGPSTIAYRNLSDEEKEAVLKLYYLYEFSDRFVLLTDKSCYGGLFNYVRTGWLTLNEVFRAFLNSVGQ